MFVVFCHSFNFFVYVDFRPRFDFLFTFECVGLACILLSVLRSCSVAFISLSFIFHIFFQLVVVRLYQSSGKLVVSYVRNSF